MHPCLRHSPENFPRELRTHVVAAANGSLDDLEHLLSLSFHKRMPERQRKLLASVWYEAVAPLPTPAGIQQEQHEVSVEQLRVALCGILGLSDLLAAKLIPKAAVPEIWERAHPWLFLFELQHGQTGPYRLHANQVVSFLYLITFLGGNEAAPTLRATSRIGYLLGRLWRRTIAHQDVETLRMLARLMGIFLTTSSGQMPNQAFQQLLEAVEGSFDELSSLIISQLRLLTPDQAANKRDGNDVSWIAMIIINERFSKDPALRHALLASSNGFIKTIINVLLKSVQLVDPWRSRDVFDLLLSAFSNIHPAEDRPIATHVLVARGIRAGYLSVVLSLAARAKHEGADFELGRRTAQVETILLGHSVYYSVLAALQPHRQLLSQLRAKRILGADELSIILRRLDLLNEYNEKGHLAERMCANLQCNVQSEKHHFKCCPLCRTSYCSSDCQRADWVSGHRSFCVQIRQDRDANLGASGSARNLSFFRFLLASEIVSQALTIATKVSEIFHWRPNDGRGEADVPCVQFDFSGGECVIGVQRPIRLDEAAAPRYHQYAAGKTRGRVYLLVLTMEKYLIGDDSSAGGRGEGEELVFADSFTFQFRVSEAAGVAYRRLNELVQKYEPFDAEVRAALPRRLSGRTPREEDNFYRGQARRHQERLAAEIVKGGFSG